jgi:adenosine deaminase
MREATTKVKGHVSQVEQPERFVSIESRTEHLDLPSLGQAPRVLRLTHGGLLVVETAVGYRSLLLLVPVEAEVVSGKSWAG